MANSSPRVPETGALVDQGRFMLGELIGEGGVARVYAADDRELGRRVAFKLLHERYWGRPEREQRLLDEAAFLQRVGGHSHVVEFDAGGRLRDYGGWPYVATVLLDGKTLAQHKLAVRSIPVQRVCSLARQIAEAVRACHRAGVVHRDVTPANLMLLGDPRYESSRIVLFDFSHAGWSEGPQVPVGHPDRRTREHEVPGTARYMPPEQVRVDPASPSMDVYAFGVVLWELITGENPFGQVGGRQEFIDLQRRGALAVPRLMAWTYAIPEPLAAIVNACLAAAPAQRPSMNAIVQDLDELLGMLDVPAPVESTSVITRGSEPVPSGPSGPEPVSVTLPIPVEAIERAQRRGTSTGEVDDDSEPTERRVVQLPSGPAFARASAAGFAPPILAPEPEPAPASSPSPRPSQTRLLATVGVVLVGLAGLGLTIVLAAGERVELDESARDAEPVKPEPTLTGLDPSTHADPVEPEPVEPEPVEPEPVEPAPVEPEPVEPAMTPRHQTSECAKVRDDANAAIEANEWLEAEKLARQSKCWASATTRLRIRVHALAQAERYDECVSIGAGHADQEIKRWVNFCQKQP